MIFKAVLLNYEEVLGKDHAETHRVACRLAFTYAQLGKLGKAETIALETLEHLASDVSQYHAAIGLSRLVLAKVATFVDNTAAKISNLTKPKYYSNKCSRSTTLALVLSIRRRYTCGLKRLMYIKILAISQGQYAFSNISPKNTEKAQR